VPETRLAAAQVTGEVEEREVRVRMIARRAHRLGEPTWNLIETRVALNVQPPRCNAPRSPHRP
jgi:hypothetical protein